MPILNGMEILEEKLGDKEMKKYKREIDIITRNASRLQNLAESILQVSRIESGRFSLSIQKEVDIHFLISQVIEDIEKKYLYTDKAKKVAIVFEPDYDKEKYKEDKIEEGEIKKTNDKKAWKINRYHSLLIDCDPQKISQVIFNLLDNAIKFTEQGQVVITTLTKSEEEKANIIKDTEKTINKNEFENNKENNENKKKKDNVIITIQDTGSGINSEIKDQLFEKFATKSTQGSGLGLYLAKKIIEAHGGRIWFEESNCKIEKEDCKEQTIYLQNENRRPTLGSEFKIRLPINNNNSICNNNHSKNRIETKLK
jgi:signal transduction histidine kinase